MRKLVVIGSSAAALALAAGAWSSGPVITPLSIAGAKLGLSKAAYKKLLGKAQSLSGTAADPSHPEDYSRLSFAGRKMEVYFKGKTDKAVEITTWNKSYRTAAGVGPCSTVAQLKKAYGSQLKPSPDNTHGSSVFAYTLGKNLLFATNNKVTVSAVALYSTALPGGHALGFAGFVALNEESCA